MQNCGCRSPKLRGQDGLATAGKTPALREIATVLWLQLLPVPDRGGRLVRSIRCAARCLAEFCLAQMAARRTARLNKTEYDREHVPGCADGGSAAWESWPRRRRACRGRCRDRDRPWLMPPWCGV